MRLYKKIKLTGTLKLLTGLHIGDSKESVEIGGVDLPVVRRKDQGEPYLPGSSIKGKMRCLLEQAYGVNLNDKFDYCAYEAGKPVNPNLPGSEICELFGSSNNISRLHVRDASMNPDSVRLFGGLKTTDMPYTEIKLENSIKRIEGTARDPRQIERVPAGAKFNLEFVVNVFVTKDEEKEPAKVEAKENQLLGTLQKGLWLLLDDYLGGMGSRGYGQISIPAKQLERRDIVYNVANGILSIDSDDINKKREPLILKHRHETHGDKAHA